MAQGFSATEEKLYYQTVEAVQRELAETPRGEESLAVIRQALTRFERAYESAPAKVKAAVVCRAGCDTCCHENVAAQAHEVLIVAEHIQKHFSPEQLEAVIAKAAVHRTARPASGETRPLATRTPCVLLKDGNCSVYEARPESCRAHHSHSLAGCQHNLAAGTEEVDVHVQGLRGRMFAVMLGIDQATETAGFDAEAYDFGSALHEALTNSLCVVRWQRHEPAFPASCRE